MKYIITLLLVSIGLLASAQVKRTVHQTFELEDENSQVTLDVYDGFETEEWSSNNIMIVTTVTLESGAQHLLDIYVKQGRYDIEATDEGETKIYCMISRYDMLKVLVWKYKNLELGPLDFEKKIVKYRNIITNLRFNKYDYFHKAL